MPVIVTNYLIAGCPYRALYDLGLELLHPLETIPGGLKEEEAAWIVCGFEYLLRMVFSPEPPARFDDEFVLKRIENFRSRYRSVLGGETQDPDGWFEKWLMTYGRTTRSCKWLVQLLTGRRSDFVISRREELSNYFWNMQQKKYFPGGRRLKDARREFKKLLKKARKYRRGIIIRMAKELQKFREALEKGQFYSLTLSEFKKEMKAMEKQLSMMRKSGVDVPELFKCTLLYLHYFDTASGNLWDSLLSAVGVVDREKLKRECKKKLPALNIGESVYVQSDESLAQLLSAPESLVDDKEEPFYLSPETLAQLKKSGLNPSSMHRALRYWLDELEREYKEKRKGPIDLWYETRAFRELWLRGCVWFALIYHGSESVNDVQG